MPVIVNELDLSLEPPPGGGDAAEAASAEKEAERPEAAPNASDFRDIAAHVAARELRVRAH